MTAGSRPSKFPRVPYASLRWLVDRLHVGTPDAEVSTLIASRIEKARAKGAAFSEAEARESVRFALAVHEDNRNTFRRVMRGY